MQEKPCKMYPNRCRARKYFDLHNISVQCYKERGTWPGPPKEPEENNKIESKNPVQLIESWKQQRQMRNSWVLIYNEANLGTQVHLMSAFVMIANCTTGGG